MNYKSLVVSLSKREIRITTQQNTVDLMIQKLKSPITRHTRILDIGSGYGGAARYIAKKYGAEIVCLNLSERENELNRKKNFELGLDHKIQVMEGNFEEIPYPDSSFHLIWSEDAILHSPHKLMVFSEVQRVLKSGGEFIFTDPMQADDCPQGVLEPIYERIHLQSLGSVNYYLEMAGMLKLKVVGFENLKDHLTHHYRMVKKEIEDGRILLELKISSNFLDKMVKGLEHWIRGGELGYLNWGILHFKKP